MSASNDFENDWLKLVFHKIDLPNLGSGDNDLFLALHTADPGEDGTQATNEAAYPGYARQAVARSLGNWTIASGVSTNTNEIPFPQATGGNESLTHWSVGRAGGGIVVSGPVTAPLAVSNGVTPKIPAGGLSITAN